jgi:rSAM/selenodomain-associated transferase 2
MKISVVVPALNEAQRIGKCIESILLNPEVSEILLVDGGSWDQTIQVAASYPRVRSVISPPSRARQLNAGAFAAENQILWFVHADSIVPGDAGKQIQQALEDSKIVGGAFNFLLDAVGKRFRVIEWGVRQRLKYFQVAYGDQGFFVRREVFYQLGGFPEVALMEDLHFWRKLRLEGQVAICKSALLTSARRWEEYGTIKTTIVHWIMIVMDWLGARPEQIAAVRKRI